MLSNAGTAHYGQLCVPDGESYVRALGGLVEEEKFTIEFRVDNTFLFWCC